MFHRAYDRLAHSLKCPRLAREERGYLLFTGAVIVPVLIIGSALAIDTAQYFSAYKLMQAATDDAARMAFDAIKARRDPETDARDTFVRQTTGLGSVSTVDVETKTLASGKSLELRLRAKILLPVTTKVTGWGVVKEFKSTAKEGRGQQQQAPSSSETPSSSPGATDQGPRATIVPLG